MMMMSPVKYSFYMPSTFIGPTFTLLAVEKVGINYYKVSNILLYWECTAMVVVFSVSAGDKLIKKVPICIILVSIWCVLSPEFDHFKWRWKQVKTMQCIGIDLKMFYVLNANVQAD